MNSSRGPLLALELLTAKTKEPTEFWPPKGGGGGESYKKLSPGWNVHDSWPRRPDAHVSSLCPVVWQWSRKTKHVTRTDPAGRLKGTELRAREREREREMRSVRNQRNWGNLARRFVPRQLEDLWRDTNVWPRRPTPDQIISQDTCFKSALRKTRQSPGAETELCVPQIAAVTVIIVKPTQFHGFPRRAYKILWFANPSETRKTFQRSTMFIFCMCREWRSPSNFFYRNATDVFLFVNQKVYNSVATGCTTRSGNEQWHARNPEKKRDSWWRTL